MGSLRVVHFAASRLAGSPIRLVRALQAHTPLDVRLVDLQRWGQFDHDVVFAESPDEALTLAEAADVVHLHDHLDYESRQFAPLDFDALRSRGTRVVRQFHSAPETVARRLGHDLRRIFDSPIPALTIAQYPERLYPDARVVPNILPQDDPEYVAAEEPGEGIVFAPGALDGAWDRRWGAKGALETAAVLGSVERRTGAGVAVVTGRPLSDVLAAKRRGLLIVDELVTGSYHLSGLEGLCLGRATLCYLDERVQLVLRELSGSTVDPFVNVRLEDAEAVLDYLVRHPDEAAEVGRAGRAWVERHWSDRELVRHFVDVYETLAEDRPLVRQPELRLDGAARLGAVVVPDLVWSARRQRALAAAPLHRKARLLAGSAYRRVPWPARRLVRRVLGRPVPGAGAIAAAARDEQLEEAAIRTASAGGRRPAQ